MSQLPQNNEDFDNNPEYANLYQGNDSVQSEVYDTDDWGQPTSELPPDVRRAQAGKRAANLSLLFGALGLLFLFLGIWLFAKELENGIVLAIVAPLLRILGIWQAFVARRYGKQAFGGLILSGIGIGIVIAIIALILLILNALSHIH